MTQNIATELFIAGFDGTHISPALNSFLARNRLGGVILFKRNLESLEQIIELNAQLINANIDNPPLISVDQEGGRVARLRGICSDVPPMRSISRQLLKDPQLAFRLGAMMGRELAALGFNLNFAPVCDIALSQADDDIIGDRAFSDQAETVALLAQHVIQGLQASGVAACAKHFPGHGATKTDSHLELPQLDTDVHSLKTRELIPFKAAISVEVASIMTAHIINLALDKKWPATMSHAIISGLLREEMAYQGLIISDDLDMKAVADHYDLEEIIEMSLLASVDMFIVGNNWPKTETAIELCQKLIERSPVLKTKAQQAQQRINKLRARYIGKALAPDLAYAKKIIRSKPHLDLLKTCV